FVLIVIVMGYFIYALFFRTPTPPVTTPGATTTPGAGGLPTAQPGTGQIVEPTGPTQLPGTTEDLPRPSASETAVGGLTKAVELNKTPSLGSTLDSNGRDLQYYNQSDGKFYRIDKNGQISAMSDKVFHSVEKVTWSRNKNKAILEYPDGANILYDFDANRQITLPQHWEDFNFAPNSDQIVMKSIGLDPANRWLAVTNDDGSRVQIIEDIGNNADAVIPSWSPNNQSVAMYTEGIDFDRQEVFFLGLNDENFKSTVVVGRNFQPLWEPTGKKLVYSVYSSDNDYKPKLWVVNAEGESIGSGRMSLNIETWADKCTFAGSNDLYCAVPENLPDGAGLFPDLAKTTTDHLYKINPTTGLKKKIAIPDGNYNMSNLIVSDDGTQLYFTDDSTKRIYRIRLK
ncbi:hypothetical protein ACFLZ9_01630, partial [Patescibacteria group bacterium]